MLELVLKEQRLGLINSELTTILTGNGKRNIESIESTSLMTSNVIPSCKQKGSHRFRCLG